ncbi:amidase family protein [Ferrimicrobium acidiphilum]|uniref:amidase family protein n=1 Tax=Ferrimicrobium acidiphilum TaxID=121039 RepID=UPI0023F0D1D2|nr:amidase family protein [Ferrimicrobium acidiphilum]
MQMTIVGAGAIGGMIGAHMAAAGHDITLCDSDHAHIDAIRANGLTIEGPVAHFTVHPKAIYAEELQGTHGCIAVAVKSHHTEAAAALIAPHLSFDATLLTIQNGLTLETFTRFIDRTQIVTAFINIGADLMAPGLIKQGNIAAFYVGEPFADAVTDRVRRLVEALPYAQPTDNILGYLWGKEAYGAMLYAGAVSDLSIADSLSDPRYQDLMIAIAQEVLDQAPVKPEGFDGFDPQDLEGSLVRLSAFNAKSAKSHSGIYRDLMVRRRPTEVTDLLHDLKGPLTTHVGRLIQAIERGERTCEVANLDLMNAYYRAHRYAEPLHAVVRYLDAPLRAPEGPLHGYQIAVKDIIAIAGAPLGNGNPIDMAGPPSTVEAPIVSMLRSLGADIFATTSLLEYALGCPHPNLPDARNPVAPALTAGGSSGGSAVMVGVGAGTLALGTDTGGSVRIPAHYCGVVGFKPSYQHLPIGGITPLSPSLDHVGILATDVATAALCYRALTGAIATSVASAVPRLGFISNQLDTDLLDPTVAEAILGALAVLKSAGYEIVELDAEPFDQLDLTFETIVGYEALQIHGPQLELDREHFGEETARVLTLARSITEADYHNALRQRAMGVEAVTAGTKDIDLIIGPTAPIVAPGQNPSPDTPEGYLEGVMTRCYNLTGQPAISIPIPGSRLPVGLQLAGAFGQDLALLAWATTIEELLQKG